MVIAKIVNCLPILHSNLKLGVWSYLCYAVNHGDNALTGEIIHLSSFIHRHCCQHPRVCVDGLRKVLHWASALPNPLTIRLTNITVTLVILCSGRLQGCQGTDIYMITQVQIWRQVAYIHVWPLCVWHHHLKLCWWPKRLCQPLW